MRQGRFDEAIEARRQAHTVAGDDRLAPLFKTARGEAGFRRIDEAWVRVQLDMLKERERTRYVSPLDFARAYAQLGEKELTFKYLDAAFADRSPGLVFLKVGPRLGRRSGRSTIRSGGSSGRPALTWAVERYLTVLTGRATVRIATTVTAPGADHEEITARVRGPVHLRHRFQ